jgi:hypothetical protein
MGRLALAVNDDFVLAESDSLHPRSAMKVVSQ